LFSAGNDNDDSEDEDTKNQDFMSKLDKAGRKKHKKNVAKDKILMKPNMRNLKH